MAPKLIDPKTLFPLNFLPNDIPNPDEEVGKVNSVDTENLFKEIENFRNKIKTQGFGTTTDTTYSNDSNDLYKDIENFRSSLSSGSVGGVSLGALEQAIKQKESSGNLAPPNADSGALGYYQMLPGNVKAWSRKYLGREVSTEEFLKNPEIQKTLFLKEMGNLLKKAYDFEYKVTKGNPVKDNVIKRAAVMWYGGPGAINDINSTNTYTGKNTRTVYPSKKNYAKSVLRIYKKLEGNVQGNALISPVTYQEPVFEPESSLIQPDISNLYDSMFGNTGTSKLLPKTSLNTDTVFDVGNVDQVQQDNKQDQQTQQSQQTQRQEQRPVSGSITEKIPGVIESRKQISDIIRRNNPDLANEVYNPQEEANVNQKITTEDKQLNLKEVEYNKTPYLNLPPSSGLVSDSTGGTGETSAEQPAQEQQQEPQAPPEISEETKKKLQEMMREKYGITPYTYIDEFGRAVAIDPNTKEEIGVVDLTASPSDSISFTVNPDSVFKFSGKGYGESEETKARFIVRNALFAAKNRAEEYGFPTLPDGEIEKQVDDIYNYFVNKYGKSVDKVIANNGLNWSYSAYDRVLSNQEDLKTLMLFERLSPERRADTYTEGGMNLRMHKGAKKYVKESKDELRKDFPTAASIADTITDFALEPGFFPAFTRHFIQGSKGTVDLLAGIVNFATEYSTPRLIQDAIDAASEKEIQPKDGTPGYVFKSFLTPGLLDEDVLYLTGDSLSTRLERRSKDNTFIESVGGALGELAAILPTFIGVGGAVGKVVTGVSRAAAVARLVATGAIIGGLQAEGNRKATTEDVAKAAAVGGAMMIPAALNVPVYSFIAKRAGHRVGVVGTSIMTGVGTYGAMKASGMSDNDAIANSLLNVLMGLPEVYTYRKYGRVAKIVDGDGNEHYYTIPVTDKPEKGGLRIKKLNENEAKNVQDDNVIISVKLDKENNPTNLDILPEFIKHIANEAAKEAVKDLDNIPQTNLMRIPLDALSAIVGNRNLKTDTISIAQIRKLLGKPLFDLIWPTLEKAIDNTEIKGINRTKNGKFVKIDVESLAQDLLTIKNNEKLPPEVRDAADIVINEIKAARDKTILQQARFEIAGITGKKANWLSGQESSKQIASKAAEGDEFVPVPEEGDVTGLSPTGKEFLPENINKKGVPLFKQGTDFKKSLLNYIDELLKNDKLKGPAKKRLREIKANIEQNVSDESYRQEVKDIPHVLDMAKRGRLESQQPDPELLKSIQEEQRNREQAKQSQEEQGQNQQEPQKTNQETIPDEEVTSDVLNSLGDIPQRLPKEIEDFLLANSTASKKGVSMHDILYIARKAGLNFEAIAAKLKELKEKNIIIGLFADSGVERFIFKPGSYFQYLSEYAKAPETRSVEIGLSPKTATALSAKPIRFKDILLQIDDPFEAALMRELMNLDGFVGTENSPIRPVDKRLNRPLNADDFVVFDPKAYDDFVKNLGDDLEGVLQRAKAETENPNFDPSKRSGTDNAQGSVVDAGEGIPKIFKKDAAGNTLNTLEEVWNSMKAEFSARENLLATFYGIILKGLNFREFTPEDIKTTFSKVKGYILSTSPSSPDVARQKANEAFEKYVMFNPNEKELRRLWYEAQPDMSAGTSVPGTNRPGNVPNNQGNVPDNTNTTPNNTASVQGGNLNQPDTSFTGSTTKPKTAYEAFEDTYLKLTDESRVPDPEEIEFVLARDIAALSNKSLKESNVELNRVKALVKELFQYIGDFRDIIPGGQSYSILNKLADAEAAKLRKTQPPKQNNVPQKAQLRQSNRIPNIENKQVPAPDAQTNPTGQVNTGGQTGLPGETGTVPTNKKPKAQFKTTFEKTPEEQSPVNAPSETNVQTGKTEPVTKRPKLKTKPNVEPTQEPEVIKPNEPTVSTKGTAEPVQKTEPVKKSTKEQDKKPKLVNKKEQESKNVNNFNEKVKELEPETNIRKKKTVPLDESPGEPLTDFDYVSPKGKTKLLSEMTATITTYLRQKGITKATEVASRFTKMYNTLMDIYENSRGKTEKDFRLFADELLQRTLQILDSMDIDKEKVKDLYDAFETNRDESVNTLVKEYMKEFYPGSDRKSSGPEFYASLPGIPEATKLIEKGIKYAKEKIADKKRVKNLEKSFGLPEKASASVRSDILSTPKMTAKERGLPGTLEKKIVESTFDSFNKLNDKVKDFIKKNKVFTLGEIEKNFGKDAKLSVLNFLKDSEHFGIYRFPENEAKRLKTLNDYDLIQVSGSSIEKLSSGRLPDHLQFETPTFKSTPERLSKNLKSDDPVLPLNREIIRIAEENDGIVTLGDIKNAGVNIKTLSEHLPELYRTGVLDTIGGSEVMSRGVETLNDKTPFKIDTGKAKEIVDAHGKLLYNPTEGMVSTRIKLPDTNPVKIRRNKPITMEELRLSKITDKPQKKSPKVVKVFRNVLDMVKKMDEGIPDAERETLPKPEFESLSEKEISQKKKETADLEAQIRERRRQIEIETRESEVKLAEEEAKRLEKERQERVEARREAKKPITETDPGNPDAPPRKVIIHNERGLLDRITTNLANFMRGMQYVHKTRFKIKEPIEVTVVEKAYKKDNPNLFRDAIDEIDLKIKNFEDQVEKAKYPATFSEETGLEVIHGNVLWGIGAKFIGKSAFKENFDKFAEAGIFIPAGEKDGVKLYRLADSGTLSDYKKSLQKTRDDLIREHKQLIKEKTIEILKYLFDTNRPGYKGITLEQARRLLGKGNEELAKEILAELKRQGLVFSSNVPPGADVKVIGKSRTAQYYPYTDALEKLGITKEGETIKEIPAEDMKYPEGVQKLGTPEVQTEHSINELIEKYNSQNKNKGEPDGETYFKDILRDKFDSKDEGGTITVDTLLRKIVGKAKDRILKASSFREGLQKEYDNAIKEIESKLGIKISDEQKNLDVIDWAGAYYPFYKTEAQLKHLMESGDTVFYSSIIPGLPYLIKLAQKGYSHFKSNNSKSTEKTSTGEDVIDPFPDIEKRLTEAEEARRIPTVKKLLDYLNDLKNSFTRHNKELDPRIRKDKFGTYDTRGAVIEEYIAQMETSREVGAVKAAFTLLNIEKGLDLTDGDRKLISRYLAFRDMMRVYSETGEIGGRFTPFGVINEKQLFDSFNTYQDQVLRNPKALEALNRREKEFRETLEKAVDLGIFSESVLDNVDSYFHRMNLKHLAEEKGSYISSPLLGRKDPKTARTMKMVEGPDAGPENDFYMNFATADFDWLTAVNAAIHKIELYNKVRDQADILPAIIQSMWMRNIGKKNLTEDVLHSMVPKGYVLYTPNKKISIFEAIGIPKHEAEKMAQILGQDKFEQIVGKKMKDALDEHSFLPVYKGSREYWVIPEEVAKVLEKSKNFGKTASEIAEITRKAHNAWAWLRLFAPHTFLRYRTTNTLSDLMTVLFYNPSALKELPQAAKSVWKIARRPQDLTKSEIDELISLVGHGLYRTQTNTFYEGSLAKYIEKINDANNNASAVVGTAYQNYLKAVIQGVKSGSKKITRKYGDLIRDINNVTEVSIRLAVARETSRKFESTGKIPKTYGTDPRLFLALEQQGKGEGSLVVARGSTGEYLKNSEAIILGSDLLAKFVRWAENTLKLPTRMVTNEMIRAHLNGGGGNFSVARTALGTGASTIAKGALKAGTSAAGIILLGTAAYLYNKINHPDDTEALEQSGIDMTKYLILQEGEGDNPPFIINLDTLGTGFFEWGGLGKLAKTITDYRENRISAKDAILNHTLYSVGNKIVNSLTVPKFAVALTTGQQVPMDPVSSSNPNILETTPVLNKSRYIASMLGGSSVYDYLTDYPSRKGTKFTSVNPLDFFFNTMNIDPREQVYISSRQDAIKWDAKTNAKSMTEVVSRSDKDDLLYKYIVALRINNPELAEFYKKEFLKNGGREKDLDKRLDYRNPLATIKKTQIVDYIESLGDIGRWKLSVAWDFYKAAFEGKELKELEKTPVTKNQLYAKIFSDPKRLINEPDGWKILVQLINKNALTDKMVNDLRPFITIRAGRAISSGSVTPEDLRDLKKAGFLVNIPENTVRMKQTAGEERKKRKEYERDVTLPRNIPDSEAFNP